MEKKMTFNYFYGTEADQFSFYRIPKALFTDSYFKDLSSDAKILYGLMLDRMSLSIKNQWFDDKNRAYIYFSIEDIMELLNCGRNKAMGSGAIKWHVHCSVCGAFIEKSAQSDSEVECKKCRSTLEIFVKDDMVSVRPIHIRDEQLKSRMRTYSRKMMNQGS